MKLCSVPAGGAAVLKYVIECDTRGYYQIGPTLLETGDLFGLHRRHRIVAKAFYLMVLPKVLPLPKYDFASQRPIGEVNVARRLFEDPTRNAGVRPYQVGVRKRVHWRATARTGELQCRVFEATTLAGASILVDFHRTAIQRVASRSAPISWVTTAGFDAYAVDAQPADRSGQQWAAMPPTLSLPDQTQRGSRRRGRLRTRDAARHEAEATNKRLLSPSWSKRGEASSTQINSAAVVNSNCHRRPELRPPDPRVTPRLPRDATVIATLPGVPTTPQPRSAA